jgi:hypothetical protein
MQLARIVRCIAVLAVMPLFCGCANTLKERQAFLATFIGRSEADVVRAFSVPDRTIETGGRKFLAYDQNSVQVIPGSYLPGCGGYWSGCWGWGGGFPPEVIQRSCETTFEIGDGKVQAFSLRGND